MGYYDYRILKIDQKLLQPCDGVQIQVVGRLVQQQNIRISEQCLRKEYLHLLSTQEISHLRIVELRSDAQTV